MASKKKKKQPRGAITTGPTREQAQNGRLPSETRLRGRERSIDDFVNRAVTGR